MRYRKILAPPPNICLDFVLQRVILLILSNIYRFLLKNDGAKNLLSTKAQLVDAGCKNGQIKDMNAYMSQK